MLQSAVDGLDFRALNIYVTTCRLGSLSRCAEQLGLAKSTVSKEIRRLEQHLDVALLERSGRSVQPTEAGLIVHQRAFQLLQDFHNLRDDLLDLTGRVQGTLRLAAPPALGEYLSRQLLPGFLQRWSRVEVAMHLSYSFEDLFAQGIDLAFRIGQIADDRLVARQLGYSQRLLVATPEYLAGRDVIEIPEQLAAHNCLRFNCSPSDTDWTLCREGEATQVTVQGNFSCGSVQALYQAALQGVGIAQLPVTMLTEQLMSGQLVQVLPEWSIPGMPIYVLYRGGVNKPQKLQVFLDYLFEQQALFEKQICPLLDNG